MDVYTYILFDPLEKKHIVPLSQGLIIKFFRRIYIDVIYSILGTMEGK